MPGKYEKGDHVKFEVEEGRESEWMWLLVESSDDEQEIVFGKLDSQPVVATDNDSRNLHGIDSGNGLCWCDRPSRIVDFNHLTSANGDALHRLVVGVSKYGDGCSNWIQCLSRIRRERWPIRFTEPDTFTNQHFSLGRSDRVDWNSLFLCNDIG